MTAVKRDLAKLPDDLAKSGLAAAAIALAREMDTPNSATSKSMCARALQESLRELRDLAPPKPEKDGLDALSARHASRLTGKPAPAHKRGT